MAIVTAGDLVSACLRTAGILGVGQTAQAEDANTGLDLLNEVIAGWMRERLLSWRLVEVVATSTGAQSYPLTDRPVRLASAFARLLSGYATSGGIVTAGPVDYPLQIMTGREQYNEIMVKSLGTFPAAVFLDTLWPGPAQVYVWPVPPAAQFELHLAYPQQLSRYAGLTTPLGLPPEYQEPLRYALALKLAMDYGIEPNTAHVNRLRGSLARLRAANIQLADLEMPAALVRGAQGGGGISGLVGPAQSVIVLGQTVLG